MLKLQRGVMQVTCKTVLLESL